ncbi:MAG: DUF5817 domain-containing protein [Salinirussus sp.]
MYAVVGCSECGALWVLEGDPERSACPRCGSQRPREQRREFFTSQDADAAREARSRMLAKRHGLSEDADAVTDFAALADAIDDAGPDDETYLSEAGLDPEEIASVDERSTVSRNRQAETEIVRDALRKLDAPDQAAVVAYCADRDVDPERTQELLGRLERAGVVTKTAGSYRLL